MITKTYDDETLFAEYQQYLRDLQPNEIMLTYSGWLRAYKGFTQEELLNMEEPA